MDTDCDDIQNGNGAKCEYLKCVIPENIRSRRESREIAVQTSLDEYQLKTISDTPSDDVEFTLPNDDHSKNSPSESLTSTSFSTSTNTNQFRVHFNKSNTKFFYRDENGNKKCKYPLPFTRHTIHGLKF